MKGLGKQVIERAYLWPGLSPLLQALTTHLSTGAYIAGGAVRDVMLGKPTSKDVDFFIEGVEPPQLLAKLKTLGRLSRGPFGAPRWCPSGLDSYVDIIFTADFNNGLSPCRDIVDALNQFDFTANAVAVNMKTLEVIDPRNGIRDAGNRIMRSVRFDYPDEPIYSGSTLTRNSILWNRLTHYQRKCGLSAEPVTAEWLRLNSRYFEDTPLFNKVFFSSGSGRPDH